MSVDNILAMYNMANDRQRQAGADWYLDAWYICQDLADEYTYPVDSIARALAALSPMTTWERNVDILEQVIQTGDGPTFKSNVEKAVHILDGEYRWLSGDKVTSFAANILGDLDAVTIDIWAWRIWAGTWKAGAWRAKVPAIKSDEYSKIADDYRAAAEIVGMTPAELQAITWTTIRELAPGNGTPLLI